MVKIALNIGEMVRSKAKRRKINEENKALATHGNSTMGGFQVKTRTNSILVVLLFLMVDSP